MFKKLVESKRKAMELKDEAKELKAYFEQCAVEDELEGGIGKIVITEAGNGVKFSERAGSPSKTKLIAAGIAEDIIKACSSTYIQMDIF